MASSATSSAWRAACMAKSIAYSAKRSCISSRSHRRGGPRSARGGQFRGSPQTHRRSRRPDARGCGAGALPAHGRIVPSPRAFAQWRHPARRLPSARLTAALHARPQAGRLPPPAFPSACPVPYSSTPFRLLPYFTPTDPKTQFTLSQACIDKKAEV